MISPSMEFVAERRLRNIEHLEHLRLINKGLRWRLEQQDKRAAKATQIEETING